MVIIGSLRSSLAYLATLGPIGHLRPAPGTIGSVVGVVSGYMIAGYGAGILAAATLLVTIIRLGRNKPGVSTKIIWLSPNMETPLIRVRVVCTL